MSEKGAKRPPPFLIAIRIALSTFPPHTCAIFSANPPARIYSALSDSSPNRQLYQQWVIKPACN